MTDETKTHSSQEIGNKNYIYKWTAIFIGGCALEFVARFIGYADNPTGFSMPLIPATTGILAAILILYGYFKTTQARSSVNSMMRRDGVLMVILGIVMMVCFFLFRQAMPLLFG